VPTLRRPSAARVHEESVHVRARTHVRSRLSTQFHVKFQRLRHVVPRILRPSRQRVGAQTQGVPHLSARRLAQSARARREIRVHVVYLTLGHRFHAHVREFIPVFFRKRAVAKLHKGVVPRRAFHRQRRLVRQRALPVPRLHLIIHHHTDGLFSPVRLVRLAHGASIQLSREWTGEIEPDVDDDRRARSVPSHDVPERSRGRGWTRHEDDGRSSRAMDDGTTTRDVDERRERARHGVTNRTHRFGTRRRDGDDEPGVHDGGGARASDAHRGDARDGDDDDDGGDEGRSGRFRGATTSRSKRRRGPARDRSGRREDSREDDRGRCAAGAGASRQSRRDGGVPSGGCRGDAAGDVDAAAAERLPRATIRSVLSRRSRVRRGRARENGVRERVWDVEWTRRDGRWRDATRARRDGRWRRRRRSRRARGGIRARGIGKSSRRRRRRVRDVS